MSFKLSKEAAEEPNLGSHEGVSVLESLLRGRRGRNSGGERVGEGVIFGASRVMFFLPGSLLGWLELLEGDWGTFRGSLAGVEDPRRGLLEPWERDASGEAPPQFRAMTLLRGGFRARNRLQRGRSGRPRQSLNPLYRRLFLLVRESQMELVAGAPLLGGPEAPYAPMAIPSTAT